MKDWLRNVNGNIKLKSTKQEIKRSLNNNKNLKSKLLNIAL